MSRPSMKLRHLQREVATALELALVALAPGPVVEALASSAGLLGALVELPLDSEPMRVWATETVARAEKSLRSWHAWEAERKATA
jgi:hypothetical protein